MTAAKRTGLVSRLFLRLFPALALLACATDSAAIASNTSATVAESAHDDSTPAYRYASMDRAACETELTHRGAQFTRVDEARGVLAPIRLTGPLRGVAFHSALPAQTRASSPYEITDCRLALALDDFAQILAHHDVVEVVHMSMYRPPAKTVHEGQLGTRHGGALAIDAGEFKKKDGTTLNVERDFHGRIGGHSCGATATPYPPSPAAAELRSIVCEAADAHLFNVELTPHYNWQHRNHFHLEVTADVKWFVVR